MLRTSKTPASAPKGEPDMINVNGAPGGMDEDGETIAESAEDDHTPTLAKLVVGVYHPAKSERVQTDITATIHSGTGLATKRLVIPGEVTVKRLGELLLSVASW